MTPEMKQKLIDITGASAITAVESVQSLWSGYGEIVRVFLAGAEQDSVVAKVVNFPRPEGDHPRGWDGQFAHERKLKSYQVELHWYRHFAQQCTALCYCPALLWAETNELGMVLVLEDLNKDFPVTPDAISLDEVKVCLQWLANFHATFVHVQPQNLWEIGSYWHLATRPDEYDRMPEGELKSFAQKIDQQLSQAQYQTLIHGDAKLANFCFSEDGRSVAAVDFQYVGQGNGMKDVAYFFSSCLSGEMLKLHEAQLLDAYFSTLRSVMINKLTSSEIDELENEWRNLHAFAWADFQRFLEGWSPGHWKLNDEMDHHTQDAIRQLSDRRQS